MSKTFSLSMPRISSITKSADVAPKAHKRATGKVLVMRSNATRAAAPPRSSSTASWLGLTSAVGLGVLAISFGFYVYMINAYASKGYELKKQQAVMKEIQETNKRLVVEQAAQGSIVKVNEVASAAQMVPVTGEEFLMANQISSR